jgi:hypothetical protein
MPMRSLFLVFCQLALVGCRSIPHPQQNAATIRLPVRFHLLAASANSAVTTTLNERDVTTLLTVANGIWKQAGIEWYAERTFRENTPAAAQFDSILAKQIQGPRADLTGFIPRGELLRPGWNVFLIRDFGWIGGGMFRPQILGVLLAERGFGFELPASGRGGATLAHELGHSLGLEHVACDSTRDIMANGCWSPTASSTLSSEQIARARKQAKTGEPVSEVPSP